MKTTFTLLMAIGALMLTSAAAQAQEQVTFAKNVAPILQQHCQVCHHVGTVAPMSLVTYGEARPWAKAIKQKVAAREMPPWLIDRNVGVQHFANDESLSDEEIATIVKWVDGGARGGKSGGHAASAQVRGRSRLADRQAGSDHNSAERRDGEGPRTRLVAGYSG